MKDAIYRGGVTTNGPLPAGERVEDVRPGADDGARQDAGGATDHVHRARAGEVVEGGVLEPPVLAPCPVAAQRIDDAYDHHSEKGDVGSHEDADTRTNPKLKPEHSNGQHHHRRLISEHVSNSSPIR